MEHSISQHSLSTVITFMGKINPLINIELDLQPIQKLKHKNIKQIGIVHHNSGYIYPLLIMVQYHTTELRPLLP
jgi:hypothetical protein